MDPDPLKNIYILLLCFALLVSIPFGLLAQPGQQTLTDTITTALKEEGLTGAGWAIRNVDHQEFFGYAGFRDAENHLPFTLETRFHVGSVSKSLLATGILRLVSTGSIDLEGPADKYLPGLTFWNPWANENPVTVRHLLDHTSGLDDARLWQMFSTRIRPDTPLIEAFLPQPDVLAVRARPGSRFSYSNMGYTLLGLIIETLTGEPYETYLDRELLEPLGMRDSSFAFTTQTGKNADPSLAWGHIDGGIRYPAAPMMLRPAGQFTTTTADWMQFARFLMSDGSIHGESFIHQDLMNARGEATTTQASLAGLKVGYAMGLSKLDRYGAMGLCHSGNIVGFSALMCVYPDSGQAFMISINTDSETADYKRIYKIIADTLSFPALPVPESSLPAADVSDWQGLYLLQPNRFESFRYLDMVFGYTRLEWRKGKLIFDPFQGPNRHLRPTGNYLLSADDRQVNSHVLLRDENNEPLISDGYRTYVRTNPAIIYGLWFSLGLALAAMLWFVVTGAVSIKRKGVAGFLTPQGVALAGILGLLLPIPVFFTQSFMALGDKTPASLMLATATVMLPLAMLVTHSKIVRNKARNNIDTMHGIAAVCVLQWCATLYYFDLLPLRLWA